MVAGRLNDFSRIISKLSKYGVLSRVQTMSGKGVRTVGLHGVSSGWHKFNAILENMKYFGLSLDFLKFFFVFCRFCLHRPRTTQKQLHSITCDDPYVSPHWNLFCPSISVHSVGEICPGRMTIASPLTSSAHGRFTSCPSR